MRFLAEDRVSGLLEVLMLAKKIRCCKTCFGATDGDDFQNNYVP
jgi:hypothetical protein